MTAIDLHQATVTTTLATNSSAEKPKKTRCDLTLTTLALELMVLFATCLAFTVSEVV
jgi:hypothetical protein